jgi:predicted amidohydrolase
VDPTLIAVAQLAITVAEPDANRRAAADAVAEAAAAGARLVVLPELCDSGYVFDAADPAAEARGLAAPATARRTCGIPRSSSSLPATRRCRRWTPRSGVSP